MARANEQEPTASAPSNGGAPVDLALRSNSNEAAQNRASSKSSADAESQQESASEDSDSSMSDDDSSSSDDNDSEDVATVTTGKKPDFSSARVASGAPSLEDRLKAFLPQLAEANSALGEEGANKYSMEDVGDDEPHIEMSLGLGVLEETKGKEGEDSSEDEDEGGEEGGEASEGRGKEKDVMGKLMGGRNNAAGGIEEVG